MTIYPIPIANNIPAVAQKLCQRIELQTCEVLVELPKNKAPSVSRTIPDNNNSMPLIIVSIAIIVTPVGLSCLFCIMLDNVR